MKTMLQIDIDFKPKDLKYYGFRLADKLMFITKIYDFNLWLSSVKVLETVKGFHLYLGLVSKHAPNDYEVLCMQQMLGDDYKRAGFNLIRILGGEQPRERWNLLFIDKEKTTKKSKLLERSIFRSYFKGVDRYEKEYSSFLKTYNLVECEIKYILPIIKQPSFA